MNILTKYTIEIKGKGTVAELSEILDDIIYHLQHNKQSQLGAGFIRETPIVKIEIKEAK